MDESYTIFDTLVWFLFNTGIMFLLVWIIAGLPRRKKDDD